MMFLREDSCAKKKTLLIKVSNLTAFLAQPHLPEKKVGLVLCKSPTAQDGFWPIPGLISCAGVTGRWGLLSGA